MRDARLVAAGLRRHLKYEVATLRVIIRQLAELIRVMPYWPRERYLELAPAYWAQTRARLDPVELEAELGFVTVPPFLVDTAQQSSAA